MEYKYRVLINWIIRELCFVAVVQMTHREKTEHIKSIVERALHKMEMIDNGTDAEVGDIPF